MRADSRLDTRTPDLDSRKPSELVLERLVGDRGEFALRLARLESVDALEDLPQVGRVMLNPGRLIDQLLGDQNRVGVERLELVYGGQRRSLAIDEPSR